VESRWANSQNMFKTGQTTTTEVAYDVFGMGASKLRRLLAKNKNEQEETMTKPRNIHPAP
jgi:hypothetical protein